MIGHHYLSLKRRSVAEEKSGFANFCKILEWNISYASQVENFS